MGEADAGTLDLARPRLASQVSSDLVDVGDAGGPDGAALGLQGAVAKQSCNSTRFRAVNIRNAPVPAPGGYRSQFGPAWTATTFS
jgi:hypothetical protein